MLQYKCNSLVMCLGKAVKHRLNTSTHVAEPEEVPGFWFWPGPALAIEWPLRQRTSVCLTFLSHSQSSVILPFK